MSDLLSPILFIMDDEADAFWCFVGFMDMVVSTNIKTFFLNLVTHFRHFTSTDTAFADLLQLVKTTCRKPVDNNF